MREEKEKCKHLGWYGKKECDSVGWCELGKCLCIDDACLFYEEEKDESKRTDKNPADNTESE
jgi:hypothetical protein